MPSTDLDICNSALVMVGAEQMNSFDDSTREARLCSQLYTTTKESELQSYLWRWSLNQVALARLVDTPLYDYSYAFQLPTDMLRLVAVDNLTNDYRTFEDKLYSNRSEVSITYQFDPDESDYPAYFVRALEFKLASILAVSLAEDENKASLFENLYERAHRRAKSLEAQRDPQKQIASHNFALTAVRGDDY